MANRFICALWKSQADTSGTYWQLLGDTNCPQMSQKSAKKADCLEVEPTTPFVPHQPHVCMMRVWMSSGYRSTATRERVWLKNNKSVE